MPTPPFSEELADRLASPTAWKFDSIIGSVFTPRFFCCDSIYDIAPTDGKIPVAVIELSPKIAYTGETINYSGTASYDPDGSVTAYTWTFDGHTPSSGTASAGTLNYSVLGYHTVELVVTDGTGLKSTPARVQLWINPPEFQAYTATSSGVYYSADSETWTAKNTGATEEAYDVKIDPATQNLDEASKTVWRCGPGNIYRSGDGGATWESKLPTSVTDRWSDSPGPSPGDLDYRQILFNGFRMFCMATWQNGSSEWRSYIFYTDDSGATWQELEDWAY